LAFSSASLTLRSSSMAAALYFEMKEFDKCIEQCDIAVAKSKGEHYDGHKMCKALGRKGNALA
jgi:hypothetical protein